MNKNEIVYWGFEGSPGVGKSTNFIRFEVWYKSRYPDSKAIFVCEPDKASEIGKAMREIFQGEKFAEVITLGASLLQVAAARAQLIESVVRPAIANGRPVFSDRCSESSRVFQVAEGYSRDDVEKGIWLATHGLEPNRVLIFDARLVVLEERLRKSGRNDDRFEKMGSGFLERVRGGYLRRAKEDPGRIVVINSEGTVDEVFGRVVHAFLGVGGA